jgi:hypothetical protein
MTRLSGHNQQKNLTQDQLFDSVMQTSEERFQQTLLGMSGQDCATALKWLVFRLDDTQDKIVNFAALVHRVYENKLAHHPEVAQIMATEAYAEAISDPVERAMRTKKEKLAKKAIITKAWGDGWVEQAAPCMFYGSGLKLG